MLKNSFNKNWFVYFQQFTLVRYAGYRRKRDVSLSGRPPNEFRPKNVLNSPYNQGYDPSSRNVYRKIKPKSDQYVFEELEDEVWKMERNNLDQKSEEERHRAFVKHKILKRKEKAKLGIKEPSILTWAARAQIRFLHAQDPYKWTPEVLADSFPVSREAIISILRSKWLPEDDEAIRRHDERVHMNWLKLKSDLENSSQLGSSQENKMTDERISKLINAAGIPSLPLPSMDEIVLTRKKLVAKLHPKTTGQFSSIISNYKAQFKKQDELSIGSGTQSENIVVAIGDKGSVQILRSICSLNESKAKLQSDLENAEEKKSIARFTDLENAEAKKSTARFTKGHIDEEGSSALHKSKVSKVSDFGNINLYAKGSRRQRRLKEVNVSSENLEDLQMLGTEKIKS